MLVGEPRESAVAAPPLSVGGTEVGALLNALAERAAGFSDGRAAAASSPPLLLSRTPSTPCVGRSENEVLLLGESTSGAWLSSLRNMSGACPSLQLFSAFTAAALEETLLLPCSAPVDRCMLAGGSAVLAVPVTASSLSVGSSEMYDREGWSLKPPDSPTVEGEEWCAWWSCGGPYAALPELMCGEDSGVCDSSSRLRSLEHTLWDIGTSSGCSAWAVGEKETVTPPAFSSASPLQLMKAVTRGVRLECASRSLVKASGNVAIATVTRGSSKWAGVGGGLACAGSAVVRTTLPSAARR